MRLPGMLYGKIFRSIVAHGRIKSIDVTAAAAVKGVHRVITAHDVMTLIPNPYYGPVFSRSADTRRRQGVSRRRVGGGGGLAFDPHVAERAAQLIDVEYERVACRFRRSRSHEAFRGHRARSPQAGRDVFLISRTSQDAKTPTCISIFKLRRGNVEAAFGEADHVIEHTFHTAADHAHAA